MTASSQSTEGNCPCCRSLKSVGKVYVPVIVDVSCSLAFARVYTSKMPVTAYALMHD